MSSQETTSGARGAEGPIGLATQLVRIGPALRAIAIIVALVAAVDPAITSNRTSKPVVSVVPVDAPRDSALARRVAQSLEKTFTVTHGAFGGASASVVVGSRVPSFASELGGPVFAVLSERVGPTVTLEDVRAPAVSPAAARVAVGAAIHVSGARGRTLEVALRSGELVVDRVTRTIGTDDERVTIPLAFVPTSVGPARLRVAATVSGVERSAVADVAVDVRDKRWAVLFFDPRPSWMSTFVRRAVERDPRFVVTSRVVTSRNVSTDVGRPPGRLDDLAALELFDAVVVGAPEALTDNDVAGLDAFLRRLGGSVVLLLDRRAPGPYDRLTNGVAWRTDSSAKSLSIFPVDADSESMRTTELAWPARLPDGADAVATPRDSANPRPIVWRSSVGAGRIVVSGALDAWRFRDRSVSGFDRFWQTLVADAANATPPALSLEVSNGIAAPGERVRISATVRDAALSTVRPAHSAVAATLEGGAAPLAVSLWPSGPVGSFAGELKAPRVAGSYRLVVSADGNRAAAPIIVSSDVARATPENEDRLAAWVAARGGRVYTAAAISDLSSSIAASPRPVTWYPMRNGWWILVFAGLLSAEWWLRRRRGLR